MVCPVFVYGSPVLRKTAVEIGKEYEGLSQLTDDLFETMYNAEGLGLAAPQIGYSLKIFVIDAKPIEEDEPSVKGFKGVFINPDILKVWGEEWLYNEGCLSIPGIREDIRRKSAIRITWYDENYELHEQTFDGIRARIILHEYDHLQGILFTDHVSPLKKRLLKSKLFNISKGKVDVRYKVKFPLR
ncbi:MAG: peptide deformylase [Bacteroidetes bacterium]|nr:peptide deformylase [Bacteroidota bacterium]